MAWQVWSSDVVAMSSKDWDGGTVHAMGDRSTMDEDEQWFGGVFLSLCLVSVESKLGHVQVV